MSTFTLIWQSPDLMIGIETYVAETAEAAIEKWKNDTTDCALVGVLAGNPEVLMWEH